MHAEIGDKVKSGDLIAEIDPDVYEAKIRTDKAGLKRLSAQKTQQQALIKQAQQKYDRNTRLYASNAVSKVALEDTNITLQVSKANLKALEAEIEASQSALEGDQTNLSYTKIYASMDGTVVAQSVQEEQTINANQTTPTIVQIANLDTMTVVTEVAEADVGATIGTAGSMNVGDYLSLQTVGADTIVRIDVDGLNGTDFIQIATLEGTTGLVVQTLYNNGDIIV